MDTHFLKEKDIKQRAMLKLLNNEFLVKGTCLHDEEKLKIVKRKRSGMVKVIRCECGKEYRY